MLEFAKLNGYSWFRGQKGHSLSLSRSLSLSGDQKVELSES